MFFLEILTLLSSSLLSLVPVYYKLPPAITQAMIAFLVILMVLLFGHRILARSSLSQPSQFYSLPFLFLGAWLIQLLVISTGGFFSPFLILIHLFTLGTGFLLNLRLAVIFVSLAVASLLLHSILNQDIASLVREDPFALLLYVFSFIIVLPLTQFLAYHYHLKDALFKVLKEYVQIGEKREESILGGLSELVLVTNNKLQVISFNEAVSKSLKLAEGEIVNHSITKVLPLKDETGKKVDEDSFALANISPGKTSTIIDNLYLQTKIKPYPQKVTVQIRPITDSTGQVSQIIFIVTDASALTFREKHANTQQADAFRQRLLQEIKQTLLKARLGKAAAWAELLNETEEDILTVFEIEDHPFQTQDDFQDVAWIGQQAVAAKQKFAQDLGVELKFSLPEAEAAESAILRLRAGNYPAHSLPPSDFAVLIDRYWLELLLNKLISIAVLLSSGERSRQVELSINKMSKVTLTVTVAASSPLLSPQEQEELFTEYYGSLGSKTNLRLGSGLEGYIVKTITKQLNLPLELKSWGNPARSTFTLTLTRLPVES